MLKEKIKNIQLPYPPTEEVLIIYNFFVRENNGQKHEGWIHDLGTDEYKCPINKLSKQERYFLYGTKFGKVNQIKETKIFWKYENEIFCFWITE